MSKKTCFKCGKEKPLREFYKHPRMRDGHLNKCQSCVKQAVADRAAEFSPEQKVAELRRHREKARRYRAAGLTNTRSKPGRVDPIKKKANNAVAKALRDGRLERQACAVCDSLSAEAHHEDYTTPLDVVWLCVKHHNTRHVHIGEQTILQKAILGIAAWIRRERTKTDTINK